MSGVTTFGDVAGLLRARMRAQADLFAAVTSHGTLIGTGRETALVELLQQIVPRQFEVLMGAIVGDDGTAAEQIDAIIADTIHYPTLLRIGQIAIAHAAAVRVVIEAKSDLSKGEKFRTAMLQIGRIRRAAGAPDVMSSAIYCFGKPDVNSILRGWLEEVPAWRSELDQKVASHEKELAALGQSEEDQKKRGTIEPIRDAAQRDRDALRPANLPDLIVSDGGAIALAVRQGAGITYRFQSVAAGTPSVLALMDVVSVNLAAAITEQLGRDRYRVASWGEKLQDDAEVAMLDLSDPPPKG